ncbi:MAG TPA: ubiquinol-cytochrome C chaperone family protein [Sphingomicrobium sp.]|jgi:cytochrome b pre-mRNA-processing protein 3|nr:ubiquinol-cytochrome C chaperone family protein [Sphingomicrobium sp.]
MLDFLFRRLTADPKRGSELFEAVTRIAREPHWYIEAEVPDTIDGRFAVLATLIALVLVRLESEGEEGDSVSVALTERFVEVMEAEHRELGLGDPTLGKTVRRLVGSLARRNDILRAAAAGEIEWSVAARDSLYKADVTSGPLEHSAINLQRLLAELRDISLGDFAKGKLQ